MLGDQFTALFDCGMVFCAKETIQNVEKALAGRNLDYIFMSHTHYDHIGALPFFREKWPQARAVTTEKGAAILLKDTPRRLFRELSATAAAAQGAECDLSYSDDAFRADLIVKDGDIIPLGGLSVEVIETPGHTRDCLSFFIPELTLLILCETTGVLLPDGYIYPAFLTSYEDTVRSIEKCRVKRYNVLSLPHMGVVSREISEGYFDKALTANTGCYNFILAMKEKNMDENEMIEAFFKEYASETLLKYQPKEAFLANAKAAISSTLKSTTPQAA